jgi:hypothetical protein
MASAVARGMALLCMARLRQGRRDFHGELAAQTRPSGRANFATVGTQNSASQMYAFGLTYDGVCRPAFAGFRGISEVGVPVNRFVRDLSLNQRVPRPIPRSDHAFLAYGIRLP